MPCPVSSLTLALPAVCVLRRAQNVPRTPAFCHGDAMTGKMYPVLAGEESFKKALEGGNKLTQGLRNKNCFSLKQNISLAFPPSH